MHVTRHFSLGPLIGRWSLPIRLRGYDGTLMAFGAGFESHLETLAKG